MQADHIRIAQQLKQCDSEHLNRMSTQPSPRSSFLSPSEDISRLLLPSFAPWPNSIQSAFTSVSPQEKQFSDLFNFSQASASLRQTLMPPNMSNRGHVSQRDYLGPSHNVISHISSKNTSISPYNQKHEFWASEEFTALTNRVNELKHGVISSISNIGLHSKRLSSNSESEEETVTTSCGSIDSYNNPECLIFTKESAHSEPHGKVRTSSLLKFDSSSSLRIVSPLPFSSPSNCSNVRKADSTYVMQSKTPQKEFLVNTDFSSNISSVEKRAPCFTSHASILPISISLPIMQPPRQNSPCVSHTPFSFIQPFSSFSTYGSVLPSPAITSSPFFTSLNNNNSNSFSHAPAQISMNVLESDTTSLGVVFPSFTNPLSRTPHNLYSTLFPGLSLTLSSCRSHHLHNSKSSYHLNLSSSLNKFSHHQQRRCQRCTCENCLSGKNSRHNATNGNSETQGDQVPRQHRKCHVCHLCNRTYGKTSHLQAHIRWHNNERPFKCTFPMCTKAFTRSDELQRHIRTHSGIKNFVCEYCQKRFMRSDHLSKHKKTHEGLHIEMDELGRDIIKSVSATWSGRRDKQTDSPWKGIKRKGERHCSSVKSKKCTNYKHSREAIGNASSGKSISLNQEMLFEPNSECSEDSAPSYSINHSISVKSEPSLAGDETINEDDDEELLPDSEDEDESLEAESELSSVR